MKYAILRYCDLALSMGRRLKTAFWLAFLGSTFSLLAPAAELLTVNGTQQYVHGVNCGWFDGQYDHDIGLNPLHPEWGTWYNPAKVQQYFQDMRNMNANVVRIWLNEGKEGLVLDSTGHVLGLDATFVTNMDDLVNRAQSVGLALYLTLNGGDSDWVISESKRTSYLENAVKPLVTRYKGRSIIFAYDVMNEIESVVGGSDGNWGEGATWDQARAYISAAAAAIHSVDPGRLVTCSSGWHGLANLQNGYFSGLGLDFYDGHVYDDKGYVPDASSLGLDKPVILGEHGQTSTRNSDTIQDTSCKGFLNNTVAGGWAGHAIWHYDHAGSTDVHRMLNADASWRRVCYTMRDFTYNPPPPPPSPSAPTNLQTSTKGQPPKHIKLTWTQSTTAGVSSNKVYRSSPASTGPYALQAILSPADTEYVDGYPLVNSGQTYYYYVTAVNSAGESPASNVAGATAR